MDNQPSLDRRGFLARLPVLPVTAVGLAAASGACAGVPFVRANATARGLVVPIAEFAGTGDGLIEAAGRRFPLYVRQSEDGSFTAVSLRCTHRGCQPEPEADRLACPCHGSEFSFDGAVLQGPAEQPLEAFETGIEEASLVITLPRSNSGGPG